jgi:hypothetical protein
LPNEAIWIFGGETTYLPVGEWVLRTNGAVGEICGGTNEPISRWKSGTDLMDFSQNAQKPGNGGCGKRSHFDENVYYQ